MKTIEYILIILIGLGISSTFAEVEHLPHEHPVNEVTKSKLPSLFGTLPLHFVANRGQLDRAVVYYARGRSATIFCTEEGLVFGFAEGNIILKFSEGRRVRPEARCELPGRISYFIGNDPVLWQTNIPTFEEVAYQNVCPGIDLIYSGNQSRLKYTLHLWPGANPDHIQMIYEGVESLLVDEGTDELVIQTTWDELRDTAPIAHQEVNGVRESVDVSFRLIGKKRVGFSVGLYNPNLMLTIDPGYSTYLGGGSSDHGFGIAVDKFGDVYITGATDSFDFPVFRAYQGSGKDYDAFITKLSRDGALMYSTYLGGSAHENESPPQSYNAISSGIAVDSSGNAYITGTTKSSDFPVVNAYQSSHAGGRRDTHDAFVAKISSDGGALVYSTYLGGDHEDYPYSIGVDNSGGAYIAGVTVSINFPTKNAYDSRVDGELDAFVAKIDTTQNGIASLVYSTYLGGGSNEGASGIAVDSSGRAYVAGWTASSNFPVKSAYQDNLHGHTDAFVTAFSSTGDKLIYSTYLGGNVGINDGEDNAFDIAIDRSGNAYIIGWTGTTDFPIMNACQSKLRYPNAVDAFVAKLSSNGDKLIYSTYLGGSSSDYAHSIVAGDMGDAYVAGCTDSTNFITTMNAYQSRYSGGNLDAFLTEIDTTQKGIASLVYSTYLGGGNSEVAYGVAVDSQGTAYVTGYTDSFDFPTLHAYQDILARAPDAFVVSFVAADMGKTTDNEKPSDTQIPTVTKLFQNYPNPFKVETWIPYQLKEGGEVTIRIYSVADDLVRELKQGYKPAGFYVKKDKAAHWDGKNEVGKSVASGVYVYVMQAGDFIETRKLAATK